MDFRSAHLKRPPVLAAGVFVAVFSAQVQYAQLQTGQRIWYSSPKNDTVSSNVPTPLPKLLESLDCGNSGRIPLPLDLDGPPADAPPMPDALTIPPAEEAQLLDMSDRRKNWILMTPAEILGTTTPEKILGIQEHDAAGRPKKTTALERYTERQNQILSANTNASKNSTARESYADRQNQILSANTKASQNGNSSPARNISRNRSNVSDLFNSINDGLENPPLNPGPDNRTLAGQNQDSGESKMFDSPTPMAAPNAAQQLDQERFRQLLGSSPSPALAATPSSSDNIFLLQEMLPNVKAGQPSQNPMGASFTPLNSGVGKPASLPMLPSAWGLSYTSSRPAAAWAPQPPPWMSADQQPFAVPQRKF